MNTAQMTGIRQRLDSLMEESKIMLENYNKLSDADKLIYYPRVCAQLKANEKLIIDARDFQLRPVSA